MRFPDMYSQRNLITKLFQGYFKVSEKLYDISKITITEDFIFIGDINSKCEVLVCLISCHLYSVLESV